MNIFTDEKVAKEYDAYYSSALGEQIDRLERQAIQELLKAQSDAAVEIGTMSTLLSGEYGIVMELLNNSMKQLMQKYPSVFSLKIANACEL